MKPAPFEYHRAASVEDAISLLVALGDEAKIVAGGQSLVPMMSFRLARPEHLIDITGVPGLDEVSLDGRDLTLGALATHQRVLESETIRRSRGHRIIATTMRHVGHLPIRARGTVGGSIAHADGSAEWPLLAVLLGGSIVAQGPGGEREIAAEDFFFGLYTSALEPQEVLTRVVLPGASGATGFAEYGLRHGDFALASAGVVLPSPEGRGARAVVSGAAPAPARLPAVEQALSREDLTEEDLRAATSADLDTLETEDDYQRDLVTTMVTRAVQEARGR
ncbi:FAD binding domain-containing protein [Janibacter sp. GS2]|uniref:FAD binding domain-containing protein n=1 Tax=Janibacter sp. GS2 TaxID=3442646 RepID=UPI003EB83252